MEFKTKINLSENRLFKQMINTNSKFNGINEFSVPLAERRLGGDYEDSIKTIIKTDILTNFEYIASDNNLVLDFTIEEMRKSSINIPEINFESEGDIYHVMPYLNGYNPYYIEGVEFFDNYNGYEYDLIINNIEPTNDGYIGTFYTHELILVEAKSLDYKGDNIVFKVNGFMLSDKNLAKVKYNIVNIDSEDYEINETNHISNNLYVLNHSVKVSDDILIGSEINVIKNDNNISFNTNIEIFNSEQSNILTSFIKISDNKYIIK